MKKKFFANLWLTFHSWSLFRHFPRFCAHLLQMKHQRFRKNIPENENFSRRFLSYHSIFQI